MTVTCAQVEDYLVQPVDQEQIGYICGVCVNGLVVNENN